MMVSWHTLGDVALRTTVIYFALFAGIRLTGARQLGQMSTFDLVLLLIIANAVQNAMVGADTSLVGGLVAAGVLLIWHGVIDRLRRKSRALAKLVSGEGIMLINHGVILEEHAHKAGISRDDLLQALREHGVGNLKDVRLAVLEPDGAISVIRNDDLKPGVWPHHRIKAVKKGASP